MDDVWGVGDVVDESKVDGIYGDDAEGTAIGCLVFLCGNAYLEDVPCNFLPLFTFSRSRRMLLNNVNMYVSKGNLMQKS